MKLQISHRTHYSYRSPVRDSFNEVRLKPVTNEHQRCEDFLLRVIPAVRLGHFQDFYLNWVSHFEVAEPHTQLSIEARSTVVTNRLNWMDESIRPAPLSRLGECARMERCFDYLQASPYVFWEGAIWRQAMDLLEGQGDVWQTALSFMRWVYAEFQYIPLATTAYTRVDEAFELRRGVCQDYAHVLIALCRAARIPALYVSGYLLTPGLAATHAWVEVYIPELGWRGLDPTHNCQPDERYVKIAVGRDYTDVPPTRGHYKGTQDRDIQVAVEIRCMDGM